MSLLPSITRFSSSDIRQLGEKMSADSTSNLQAVVNDPKSPLLMRDMAGTELVKRGAGDKVPVAVLQDLNKNPRLPDDIRSKVEARLGERGTSVAMMEFTEID